MAWHRSVDTNGDKTLDARFLDAVMAAEAPRLNPNATRTQLERQKAIIETWTNMPKVSAASAPRPAAAQRAHEGKSPCHSRESRWGLLTAVNTMTAGSTCRAPTTICCRHIVGARPFHAVPS